MSSTRHSTDISDTSATADHPEHSGKTAMVIVESPTKAKTIGRFLGAGYQIEASVGHIRDLPENAKEVPEAYRDRAWARLGVNVDDRFEPLYVVPADKKTQVRKLKDLLKKADVLYLATDEDREGEAISWHLLEVLQPKIPVRRLVFHEITKSAIHEALAHPREIDTNLVRAQEVRRIVDRLCGYEVSPLLWRKIGPKLSAGRVQSVAVRLVVERERQRMRFTAANWWDLLGTFSTSLTATAISTGTNGNGGNGDGTFAAPLTAVGDRRLPTSRDFDPDTGRLKNERLLRLDAATATTLADRLRSGVCRVLQREEKPFSQHPAPPFTTSTLQQEANRKFGFTARQTMQIAQNLYENGYITYMRTDSTNLSSEAIGAARRLVESEYGREYLPDSPRVYRTKVKNAQEAHEAIRPSGSTFAHPGALRTKLLPDAMRLYDLIWKRAVASQMESARGRRATVTIGLGDEPATPGNEPGRFEVSGSRIEFPGFLRAYVEGSDDPMAELADRDTWLPPMEIGQQLRCVSLELKSHTTAPPNRYSEAALTRTLEEKGIGRPSTYASIIETILARQYVVKRAGALVPTWTAFAVLQLLESHLAALVDYDFTAKMEDELDDISRGELNHLDYLREFYFGDTADTTEAGGDTPHAATALGLKPLLAEKAGEISAREVNRIPIGTPPGATEPICVRVGRYGPYLEQGERHANFPESMTPDEMTLEKAVELLDRSEQTEQPLGICTETGRPIYVKVGRFGPYVQRDAAEEGEKPQYASLLKGMTPEMVTLDEAVALLALPKTLGTHPESGEPIVAASGRFGPYVKCGGETRSLTDEQSPLRITLDEAVALLAQPKESRRGGRTAGGATGTGKGREPLRSFETPSPVTGKPIRLMPGRFGPYVTDGVTNASLPRDSEPEHLTFEQAVTLLEQRAARDAANGKKPRRDVRKTATKKTATKKATTKKTATKKTAKKTSAKKATAKKTTVKKSTRKTATPKE